MIKSFTRGYEIEFVNDEWIYSDTKEPTAGNERDCGYCKLPNTPEGHDGCLGTLPNVMNACCGHGSMKEVYVQFWDKTAIRGQQALDYIKGVKANDRKRL